MSRRHSRSMARERREFRRSKQPNGPHTSGQTAAALNSVQGEPRRRALKQSRTFPNCLYVQQRRGNDEGLPAVGARLDARRAWRWCPFLGHDASPKRRRRPVHAAIAGPAGEWRLGFRCIGLGYAARRHPAWAKSPPESRCSGACCASHPPPSPPDVRCHRRHAPATRVAA